METEPRIVRGEYRERGEYHGALDPRWAYAPVYGAKLTYVRHYLDRLPRSARVLDAGSGEGVLVREYRDRLRIYGVDHAYAWPRSALADVCALPFGDASFDHLLCLDVLEHVPHVRQPSALGELRRVLRAGGTAILAVPNLAHLQSRLNFLLRGKLIRTASEARHPGERPVGEFEQLFAQAGFRIGRRTGIAATLPVLTPLIRRSRRLTRMLTTLLPKPSWCFLVIFQLQVPSAGEPGSS